MIYGIILLIIMINVIALYDLCHLYDAALRRTFGISLQQFVHRRNSGQNDLANRMDELNFGKFNRVRLWFDAICSLPLLFLMTLLGKVLKSFVPGA